MRAAAIALAGIAVLALVLSGFFKAYPIETLIGSERTVILDPATYSITHQSGLSYRVDLSALQLEARADNAYAPAELHVRFFEDDVPLTNETDHCRIAIQPGLYSHWDHYLLFSPRADVPASAYSIRYLDMAGSHRIVTSLASSRLWWWVASACLAALTVGGIRWPWVLAAPVPTFLLLGLAVGIVPHVVQSWDRATVMADSDSYLRNIGRPPLYPWFIHATKGAAEIDPARLSLLNRPSDDPALLRVIRAQRLCFWGCFLTAAWAVSLLVARPLAVWFFFTLHFYNLLLPDLETSVMSEPLALAFLFLVISVFCIVLAKGSLPALPALAAAFSCLMLTRSAGVFTIVLLLIAGLAAVIMHWRRKLALAGAAGGVAIIGMMALGLLLWNSHARNGIWALSPLKNCERIAFALQCADVDDLERLPDAEARHFLRQALVDMRAKRSWANGLGPGSDDFDLNFNAFQIAVPIAQGMFEADARHPPLPGPGTAAYPIYISYVDGLFGRIADPVLAHHRIRYLAIVRHSLAAAVYEGTRLKLRHVPFLLLVAAAFLGCLIGRNRCALAAAGCVSAHLLSLAIICFQEMPLTRYIYFSEWICLLGFLLAAWACGQRLWARHLQFDLGNEVAHRQDRSNSWLTRKRDACRAAG